MTSRRLVLLLCLVLCAGGCAPATSRAPLTPRLAQELFATPEDFNRVQVLYQGYRESATGALAAGSTRFRFADEQTDKSLTLGGIPILSEVTTVHHDDIVLPNGTPGVVTAALQTAPGVYRLTVDFGGVTLEFESRNPYKQFQLVSERIEADGKSYELEPGTFGWLAIEAYEFKKTAYHESVREIQGRWVE